MMKAIIVDDEKHCQDALIQLVSQYGSGIQLVGVVASVTEAKAAIYTHEPDVIFLDVHLNGETGFDLLKELAHIDFYVVFTTAFEEYAVKAFKFSAFDYLLKPIDYEEFKETVERLMNKQNKDSHAKRLEVLVHNFENKVVGVKKIAVPTLKDYIFLNVPEIIRCESDGNYTNIFSVHGKRLTSSKTLKYFEGFLNGNQFFRIHKSHFVNLSHVEKYIKGKGGYVVMSDGAKIEVAVRRKEEFLKHFSN